MPVKREPVGGHDMDEMVGVTCSRCKETKPATAFGKDKRKVNGLSSWCKPCCSYAASRWARNNRQRADETRRRLRDGWSPERKEQELAKRRQRDAARKDHLVAWRRQYFYGLSSEDYANLLLAQGGQCAICHADQPGGRHGWNVDHDHKTGRVRGLLCRACNMSLGGFKDDVEILLSAVRYLEEP